MRFIADNMLGKLAKWLRFMGYDVLYPKTMADKDLIKLSRTERRCLLTRDKELAKIKDLNVFLVESVNPDDQIKQVINEFDLTLNGKEFTRCPECNHPLEEIDKSQIPNGSLVPLGVRERQDMFWICNGCERYYWQGTHYKKIKAKLEGLYNK